RNTRRYGSTYFVEFVSIGKIIIKPDGFGSGSGRVDRLTDGRVGIKQVSGINDVGGLPLEEGDIGSPDQCMPFVKIIIQPQIYSVPLRMVILVPIFLIELQAIAGQDVLS